MERATLDDIIRLKLRNDEQAKDSIDIEIESIGKTMQFKAPTRDQQLDFISAAKSGKDISGSYPAFRQFVYDCCPILHSEEIQNQLAPAEPSEIVDKLFTPLEVIDLGDQLVEKFLKVGADIKN